MSAPALSALLAISPAFQPAAPVPAASGVQPAVCVYDGRTGAPSTWTDLLAHARRSTVIHAGEKHDSAPHHALQAQLVRDLNAAAGFEMLYASHQGALDAYLPGTTDAAAFQAAVDWKKTWGFAFSLYEPVFDAVRAGRRSGAALNIPKAIVHKVAQGGLASLTPAERVFVPANFQATTDPAYLAMLRETFEAHGGDVNDAVALGNFVDAMSLWNEGMAANAAAFVSRAPGVPLVLIEGGFHAYDAGVPASLARRAAVTQTTIVFTSEPSCPASLPPSGLKADFVVVAP